MGNMPIYLTLISHTPARRTPKSLTWLPYRSKAAPGKYLRGDRFRIDGVTIFGSQLVLGWWFADRAKAALYLSRAVGLIRTFFLDPATAMNPNMNFAQGTAPVSPHTPKAVTYHEPTVM